MKKSIFLSSIIFIFLSSNLHAALIDRGPYTSDSISQLDWLDLNATTNMTMSTALDNNTGWRFATNNEVEDLFGQLFPGYQANCYIVCGPNSDIESEPSGFGPLHDLFFTQIDNFTRLFGLTSSTVTRDDPNQIIDISWGFYIDEAGAQRFMGTYSNLFYEIWGLNNYESYMVERLYTIDSLSPDIGTFLVRTSVVPVPASIWLFMSGFISLIAFRRKIK